MGKQARAPGTGPAEEASPKCAPPRASTAIQLLQFSRTCLIPGMSADLQSQLGNEETLRARAWRSSFGQVCHASPWPDPSPQGCTVTGSVKTLIKHLPWLRAACSWLMNWRSRCFQRQVPSDRRGLLQLEERNSSRLVRQSD